jgi:hypothetical protein
MPSDTEIQRLAASTNQLRPEWPTRSLVTYLTNNHAARAYRDLAVALAYLATDPTTLTPARLGEAGPWWRATEEQTRTPVGRRVACPFHDDQPASRCTKCREEAVPPPAGWRERSEA